MKKIKFAAVGDCTIDCYQKENKFALGGSAYNLVINAKQAGAQAGIVSTVGNDRYGKLFLSDLKFQGITTDRLSVVQGKTSKINIKLDGFGKPVFLNWELGVLENFYCGHSDMDFIKDYDIAVSVLFKPMEGLFNDFCKMKLPKTLKIGDFAGDSDYGRGVGRIKKHIEGLDIAVKSLDASSVSGLRILKKMSGFYGKMIIVLLGGAGSVVFNKGEEYKAEPVWVDSKNTVGAGDAYIANFAVAYLKAGNIDEAMKKATLAASQRISQERELFA